VAQDGGDTRLFLNTSAYSEQSNGRLGEYALAGSQSYGDFDLTTKTRSTEDLSANGWADVAVVFGYKDANNYSFVMLSKDPGSTVIQKVVNGVGTAVATATTPGITDNAYHNVQVSRRGQTVTVSVDGQQLVTATDAALATAGQVGVGSYNDAAYFDDVNVTVPVTQSPTAFSSTNQGDFANYTPLTPSRWSLADDGGDRRLFLNTSAYSEQPNGMLGEYALVTNSYVGDFDMSVNARSNEDLTANGWADVAVVFGYKDANNYSFVMLSKDAGSTVIQKVVNGVGTAVATATTPGITDTAYHNVQVSRRGQTVTVSVDGQQILSGSDAALATLGQVGVGSYNDSAYFDDISVTVPPAAAPALTSAFSTSKITTNSVLA
jgi:molybdopterin-guanine dinucleotide biosynthesis protein